MQVAKWGNSLAVRLPAALVEALELKAGDEVTVDIVGTKAMEIARKPDRRQLIERLRRYRGLIPADFKFDRLEANER